MDKQHVCPFCNSYMVIQKWQFCHKMCSKEAVSVFITIVLSIEWGTKMRDKHRANNIGTLLCFACIYFLDGSPWARKWTHHLELLKWSSLILGELVKVSPLLFYMNWSSYEHLPICVFVIDGLFCLIIQWLLVSLNCTPILVNFIHRHSIFDNLSMFLSRAKNSIDIWCCNLVHV